MSSPKVVVIVLQYNNSTDTVKCLETVRRLNYPDFVVVVVDNASDANHRHILENFISSMLDSRFYFLASNSNLGYAGGNNLGIKYALEKGAKLVLILNNDTLVPPDLLITLTAVVEEHNTTGIVGPAIDEGFGLIARGGTIKWLCSELNHIYNLNDRPKYKYRPRKSNYYLPGVCILIKKEVIDKIGMLDERYFLYFEDADYCLRAQKAGFNLVVAREAIIKHVVSSSTSQLGLPRLLCYHFRNAHLFNSQHGPVWVKFLLPFWSIFIIIKQLVKIGLFPGRREISRGILKGVIHFYKGKF
mgnify:CR=1 FL=1